MLFHVIFFRKLLLNNCLLQTVHIALDYYSFLINQAQLLHNDKFVHITIVT